jgi:predicted nucleic acid-binding protein
MAGPVVVPDASVLLKWVLRSADEDDQARALALKGLWLEGAVDILVPTLWIFEAGNVLGLKQTSIADRLLGAMIDLAMPEVPPSSYVGAIFDLMRKYGVTFYDAAYHALALSRDGVMLTADRRYVKKCQRAGHVALIDDWRPSRV